MFKISNLASFPRASKAREPLNVHPLDFCPIPIQQL